ncbi:hypothetical protein SKAU_G00339410 [Synaphobranchus kaupii]|uniref:Uncharacterized protein n=1 Tax=Synaphobranchus kaupii TaxID=118154 RepID=A0A9Q1EMW8_SYNKA|nr:hypothetical protein SKAU_G00339410 [Synaphobranchus kaupii]
MAPAVASLFLRPWMFDDLHPPAPSGSNSDPSLPTTLLDPTHFVTMELEILQADTIIRAWMGNSGHLAIAKNKSGVLRVCLALRLVINRLALPLANLELMMHFHRSTVCSKPDLCQGYLQVPLHPDSSDMTAFVTHGVVPEAPPPTVGLTLQLLPPIAAPAPRPVRMRSCPAHLQNFLTTFHT